MISKKRLIYFISILIIFFQSASFLNAKEIYAFCLISRSDIKNAKLAQEEYSRFAGKEIKFILLFPVEEGDKHLIADVSDEEDTQEEEEREADLSNARQSRGGKEGWR